MAVSFSSLGTPPRLGPLAFPAASFCDAGLDQKIDTSNATGKHEDARSRRGYRGACLGESVKPAVLRQFQTPVEARAISPKIGFARSRRVSVKTAVIFDVFCSIPPMGCWGFQSVMTSMRPSARL